jgi:hypothetical protein
LIFYAIVKKRRDRKIFVTTILQDSRGNYKEMRDVWGRSTFADLTAVNMGSVKKRAIKSIGQQSRELNSHISLGLFDKIKGES